jgi:hypothetical protein
MLFFLYMRGVNIGRRSNNQTIARSSIFINARVCLFVCLFVCFVASRIECFFVLVLVLVESWRAHNKQSQLKNLTLGLFRT